MINKILIAVDYSPNSPVVYDTAVSLARTSGAELMLLHVLTEKEPEHPTNPEYIYYPIVEIYQPTISGQGYARYLEEYAAYEQKGLEFLKKLTEEATKLGISTQSTQLSGSPGREICKMANNWKADLIVVGSRGLQGVKEMFLGSVSNYVTHHAPCSVLIARDSANESESN